MPDFIPRKDHLAATWGDNFVRQIEMDDEHLLVPAETVAMLRQRVDAFLATTRVDLGPGTRTRAMTENKRAARAAFEYLARSIAGMLRGGAAHDPAIRVRLGLATGPGRSAPRRRVNKPGSAPMVSVRTVDGSRVTIGLMNADTPYRRGLDADIACAQIYTHVGQTYPAALSSWRHRGGTSRGITTIDLGPMHRPGTQIWITARWCNRRAEMSKHATPVTAFLGYCGTATKPASAMGG